MKRKMFLPLLVLAWFLVVLTCIALVSRPDNLTRDQIFSLVRENHAFLRQCIDANDPDRALALQGIQKAHVDQEEGYVDFYCGGAGLTPSSSDYGFYYSPADLPLAADVTATNQLTPQANGWGWKQPDGDNTYYTERIMDCWYYYESHF